MIFLISGKMGSGKDTFGNMLKEEAKDAIILNNGAYLKFLAKNYLGWSGKKDEKGRRLLQEFGTDIVRDNLGLSSFWVDTVIDQIKIFSHYYSHFIITDSRFPNEIEKVKSTFPDVVAIRIEAPQSRIQTYNEQHISETALDDFKFDIVVDNSGSLDQLREIAKSIIQDVI